MNSRRFALWLCALVSSCALATRAYAHGLHAHVHVTGWAIENLPDGELRSFFDDSDVFHAALSGAMFPDTGYALDRPGARDYGEWAHWEPFIESFVQYIRTTYGPDYDTKEEKMLIAFLMGVASHGMEDEIFDSTFVYETEQRDGHGQEVTDPGLDGFLVLDGYFRLLPEDYFPVDEILPLFATLNQPLITSALIKNQISTVRNAYVNGTVGIQFAAGYGRRAQSQIPWARAHYLDFGTVGSLATEVEPVKHYIEALWARLHDRFDEADLVIQAFPDPPRRLREGDHNSAASWITLVLGKAVKPGTATGSLVDAVGNPQPFDLRYSRYGGYDSSRLIRIQPSQDLVPGAHYTVTINAGAELLDGTPTTLAHQFSFQVGCTTVDDPLCPAIGATDDAIIALPSPTVTATPTASATASETATAQPSVTPEPSHTATSVPSTTLTPRPTPTDDPGPTRTSTPQPTHTFTPTPPLFGDNGCQMTTSTSDGMAVGWLVLAPLLMLVRRHR